MFWMYFVVKMMYFVVSLNNQLTESKMSWYTFSFSLDHEMNEIRLFAKIFLIAFNCDIVVEKWIFYSAVFVFHWNYMLWSINCELKVNQTQKSLMPMQLSTIHAVQNVCCQLHAHSTTHIFYLSLQINMSHD